MINDEARRASDPHDNRRHSRMVEGSHMTGHTPGPWVVGEYDEFGGYDCMSAGIRIGPDPDEFGCIAKLDGSDYEQVSFKPFGEAAVERMKADARLIAAAPELFEAASKFLSVHSDEYGGEGMSIEMYDAIEALCAAIAKAEGRS